MSHRWATGFPRGSARDSGFRAPTGEHRERLNRERCWLWPNSCRAGTVKSHQKISDTEDGFTGTLDDLDSFGSSVASLGDLDGDWDIDLADLTRLLSNYGSSGGATYQDGDIDFDGDVDLEDLSMLLSVYGTTCD